MHVSVCVYVVLTGARRGCQIPWTCSYQRYCTVQCGYWEQNLGLLSNKFS